MEHVPAHGVPLTFHLDPALKAEFERMAESRSMPPGEVLRELVKEFVARQHQCQLLAEARRQSREAAAVAADPNSDEAAILKELSAGWKERENG